MNKIVSAILCAAALSGCRTHPVTPEESWSDYSSYYHATGEAAVPPAGAADIRIVQSAQMDSNVARLKAQGCVVLGNFKIDDGTEITYPAVGALAKKLNASVVVWSSASRPSLQSALQNPDMGIVGTDPAQVVQMNARRPDETFAEQTMRVHQIFMLGKKQ